MTARLEVVLCVDTPVRTLAEAEHQLLALRQQVELSSDSTVCTHEVRSGTPHYAFSFGFASPPPAGLLDTIMAQFPGCSSAVVNLIGQVDGDVGGEDLLHDSAGVRQAIHEVRARHGGRAFSFPGCEELVGNLPISRVLEIAAIDRIAVLGGGFAESEDVLQTRDYVRPRWDNGELVLPVMPSGVNAFAPFEVPNPTPCCTVHGQREGFAPRQPTSASAA
jgi:hypothetical protein